jgi:hypothetical protein
MELPTGREAALYAFAAATVVIGAWGLAPATSAYGICCYSDEDCSSVFPGTYCYKFAPDETCSPVAYSCRDLDR